MSTLMKKYLPALVLAASFSAVQAWEFDMAEFKCEDMDSKETAAMVLFWLDGYISAKQDDTIISNEWVEELAAHIKQACAKNTSQSVLSIVQDEYIDE